MSNVYCYEILLPTGRSRWGVAAIAVEKDASAKVLLEKKTEGIVLRLHRFPSSCAAIYHGSRKFTEGSIGASDLAGMLRDLAVMSANGIPLLEAIRTLAADQSSGSSRRVAAVCGKLFDDLNAGSSMTAAFKRQGDVFPETVRHLVEIGDETGTLHLMLMEAAEHLGRVTKLRADVQQAMIYPLLSFLAVFGAGGFWISYVMPQMVSLFNQMHATLPPLTVNVLAFAAWINLHWIHLAVGTFAALIAAVVIWRQSTTVRRWAFALVHRVPIVRGVLVSSGLAVFTEYLPILLRSGLGIVKSLTILEGVMGNAYYRERVGQMRQFLERGGRISDAMRHVGGFPPMMVRMVAVGEDSGTLDAQLAFLATEYAARLKRTVATLAEVVKPMVVVLGGGLFLFLIVALLLPVYDLVRQTMGARP